MMVRGEHLADDEAPALGAIRPGSRPEAGRKRGAEGRSARAREVRLGETPSAQVGKPTRLGPCGTGPRRNDGCTRTRESPRSR